MRGLLTSDALDHSSARFGLTSNPAIYYQAIRNAGFYDGVISQKALAGKSGETSKNTVLMQTHSDGAKP